MAMSPELEAKYKKRLADAIRQKEADAEKSWAGESSYVRATGLDKLEESSIEDLIRALGGSDGWDSTGGIYTVLDEDPAAAEFRSKFGDGEFENVEIRNQKIGNNLRFSYEKPEWFEKGSQDNTRIMQLDDGRYVWEENNLSGNFVKDEQAVEGFFSNDLAMWAKIGAVFAGAMGIDALLAGVPEAVAGEGLVQLSGPGSTMTGVDLGVEAATGLETAGAGAAEAAGTVSTDGMWNLPGDGTLPPGEGATPMPSTPSAPGPAAAPPPASGSGILNNPIVNGAREAGTGAWNWYNNLSPAARQILGTAATTGARALLASSAQQNAEAERRGAEDRKREDEIRRGAVTPVGAGAYAPRPVQGGLIDSRIPRGG